MIDQPLVFVDVETTGGSYTTDRVIEVGLIRVVGGAVEREYSTLVNPQRYLPPEITRLTGIEPFELENSPDFSQLRHELYEFFEDAVFVAHNVAFDYGFMRSEFRRFGLQLDTKKLCTVKLSRLLYPDYRRHNLDALIDRHGFTIENRHRALDDARILWQFYQKVQSDLETPRVQDALTTLLREPNIPAHLSKQMIETLPEGPGVYIFRNKEGAPLYVGKSMTIRDRVKQHLHAAYSETKKRNMAEETYDIETIPCAGDLASQLLELRLIRELKPIYNRALRPVSEYVMARKYETRAGYLTVALEKQDARHPGKDPSLVRDLTGEALSDANEHATTPKAKTPAFAGVTREATFREKQRGIEKSTLDTEEDLSTTLRFGPTSSAGRRDDNRYSSEPDMVDDEHDNTPKAKTPAFAGVTREATDSIYGVWRTMNTAKTALEGLAKEHGLCRRLLGLERGHGACFAYHLGECKGACVGKELPLAYNMRFAQAFAEVKLKPWPFPGSVRIRQEYEDLQEYLVCDQWQHVGTIRTEDAEYAIVAGKSRDQPIVDSAPSRTSSSTSSFERSNGRGVTVSQGDEWSEAAGQSVDARDGNDTTRDTAVRRSEISDFKDFDYDVYRILLRFLKREYNRRMVTRL